ncbi:MAG: hypothetical protein WAV28_00975 [Sedimentisphaerales bacterium]
MKINPIGHLVKTNPIQTQSNPILSAVGGLQMNISFIITMNYEKFIPLAGYKKQTQSKPISNRAKNSWPKAKLKL